MPSSNSIERARDLSPGPFTKTFKLTGEKVEFGDM